MFSDKFLCTRYLIPVKIILYADSWRFRLINVAKCWSYTRFYNIDLELLEISVCFPPKNIVSLGGSEKSIMLCFTNNK